MVIVTHDLQAVTRIADVVVVLKSAGGRCTPTDRPAANSSAHRRRCRRPCPRARRGRGTGAHAADTAKTCIFINMVGGPAQPRHVRPEADAPRRTVRGPFGPIQTKVPGVHLSELFPKLAGLRQVQPDPLDEPRRAAVPRGRVPAAQHRPPLPRRPRVAERGGGDGRISTGFTGNGVLPRRLHLPGRRRSTPASASAAVLRPGLSRPRDFRPHGHDWTDRTRDRRARRSRYDRVRSDLRRTNEFRAVHGSSQSTSSPPSSTPPRGTATRTAARSRTDLDDVRDTVAPAFDTAFAALLTDLDGAGSSTSTLVVATGEFGRTPRLNANGGRDHWAGCWTARRRRRRREEAAA